jgi:hypothetical protein
MQNNLEVVDSIGMRFVLTYSGALPPNGSPAEKHAIRRALLPQLRKQWDIEPILGALRENGVAGAPAPIEAIAARFTKGGFRFVPLVLRQFDLVCYLDMTLLRNEAPGAIIQPGGDIDNRLKTLFDSLSVPPNMNQMAGLAPAGDENPFYCLLEDDSLVTGFQIKTERLLEIPRNPNDVRLSMAITVRPTRVLINNLGFLGGWL